MPRSARVLLALILTLAVFPAALTSTRAQQATPMASPAPPTLSANVTVFAAGLDNPRGLRFGPDGLLYVAEGGTGGTRSRPRGSASRSFRPSAPIPVATRPASRRSTPRGRGPRWSRASPPIRPRRRLGSLVSGVADIAFIDDTLYYLMAGAGCSHGHPDVPNGVFRIEPDGTTTLVADLSAFVKANPVAAPNPGDFEPDEGAYAMAERSTGSST